MNERIREFAEQCVGSRPYNTFDYEKFAQLIVRECAGITDDNLIPDHPITGAVYDGIQSKKILEHFGVE